MACQVQGPGRRSQPVGFRDQGGRTQLGRDQEARVRTGAWADPAAGEITVTEWIDRWNAVQDVGLSTAYNREYLIRRFLRPYWGARQLNSLTGEEITVWENDLPAAARVSRRTARDARSLLHTILGDAAAGRPALIPFNPAIRPRNRGRRTGRALDRSLQRAWATPLEVLLAAERAALLAGRDDEFTMLVTIAYTGMRWGETIGLERDLLLPTLINVEWQLREIRGRFFRLPLKDDSHRSTNWEPLVPVDTPVFLAELLTAQADKYARHSHKMWMVEDDIPEILAEQRLGHDVPGMRGLYAHASQRMREELLTALQGRWEQSLRQRAGIHPHSPVPLLDSLLAPFRANPARAGGAS